MNNTTSTPESVGMSTERLMRIRPIMEKYVEQRRFAGISTMLARRGQIVHCEQVGLRDCEAQLPMTPETIFRIYSMTKPVVCTALMTLYEEGHFHLLDPVAKFIPAFGKVSVLANDGSTQDLARPIQVRDLMTHTSGLTYDFFEDSPVCQMYRDARIMNDSSRSLEELVDELARLPLAFQPGERWNYSVGIDVVGHLVELLSGQPLAQFLHERIFNPLGMQDTGFAIQPEKQEHLAAMYGVPDIFAPGMTFSMVMAAMNSGQSDRRDLSATHPVDDPCFARGGYGLFSTIGDYMRFAQMLLNRGHLDGARILGRKTVEFMHMNHLSSTALLSFTLFNPGCGFGLGIRVIMDVAATGQPGSVGDVAFWGAAKTVFWVDPQEELIGLFMTQYMMSADAPEQDFRVLAYQALVY